MEIIKTTQETTINIPQENLENWKIFQKIWNRSKREDDPKEKIFLQKLARIVLSDYERKYFSGYCPKYKTVLDTTKDSLEFCVSQVPTFIMLYIDDMLTQESLDKIHSILFEIQRYITLFSEFLLMNSKNEEKIREAKLLHQSHIHDFTIRILRDTGEEI